MEVFLSILESQTVLILYFLIGILLRRRGIVSERGVGDLTALVVRLLLPVTIFDSFRMELTAQDARTAALLLAVSSGVCLLSYGVGALAFGRCPAGRQSVMRYSALISNCTFVGLPLLSSVYGARGAFYASVFVIPNRFFMWSLGVMLFDRSRVSLRGSLRRMLLNACMIACFLGVAVMLLPIPLPRVLTRVTGGLSACTGPLSMLTIGAILAQVDLRSAFNRDTLAISLVRLVLLPLLTWGILSALGADALIIAVAVLMTGMPLANTVILLARQYGCEVELAAQATLISVLLSMMTVPLLTCLLS